MNRRGKNRISTNKQRSSLLLAALLCLSHPALALELNEQTQKGNDPKISSIGLSKNDDELKLEAIISKSHSSGDGKIDKAWLRHFENGNIEFFQGHLDTAKKHFLESIRQLKKKNIKDERLLKSRIRLAQTFLKEGKTLDAQDTFKLAIQTAEEIDKKLSQDVATAFNGMAKVYKLDGKYKKSETYIKKALTPAYFPVTFNSIDLQAVSTASATGVHDDSIPDATDSGIKFSERVEGQIDYLSIDREIPDTRGVGDIGVMGNTVAGVFK